MSVISVCLQETLLFGVTATQFASVALDSHRLGGGKPLSHTRHEDGQLAQPGPIQDFLPLDHNDWFKDTG